MRWLVLIVLIWIVGCAPRHGNAPTSTPSRLNSLTCPAVTDYTNERVRCIMVQPETLALQSPNREQITLPYPDVSLTFDSTIVVSASGTQWTIATLDGINIISAGGVTRIVHPGAQVTLSTGHLSTPSPYQPDPLWADAITQFERPINLPDPIRVPIELTDESSPLLATGCTRPSNWSLSYTIQRGDSLSRIAAVYGVTLEELQGYNCIENPNRLTTGDTLFIPALEAAVTPTPLSVSFYADKSALSAGECTTIHWDAADASVVYFQGAATARADSRSVCLSQTTTYTLLIIDTNGAQIGYTLTITVE